MRKKSLLMVLSVSRWLKNIQYICMYIKESWIKSRIPFTQSYRGNSQKKFVNFFPVLYLVFEELFASL